MANHASALKRARQNEKRRDRNRAYRTRVRRAFKALDLAIEENNPQTAAELLKKAESIMDRAASKGVYHPRTASRKVSRLSKRLAAISA